MDAALAQDPHSRVAVETLLTTGLVVLAGEITTTAVLDFAAIARQVICEIGYDTGDFGFDGHAVGVITALGRQSPDIARGVTSSHDARNLGRTDPFDAAGAGDQGMMFGYATNETPELMSAPIVLAHRLARRLAQVRRDGLLPYLRPDGKTRVTVRYDGAGRPAAVEKVLISTQHEDGVAAKLPDALWDQVVTQVQPRDMYDPGTLRQEFYVNPTGRFVIGGPVGDTGLTGRKIIVDSYGGFATHGGGAFSGKDPHQGGPVRLLRGAPRGQEHRGRRARRPGRSPGGLRHRRRPAAVPARRDLRHREDRHRAHYRAGGRPLRPAPRGLVETLTCAAPSTGGPRPTGTSAATSRDSPGSAPTAPPPSAAKPDWALAQGQDSRPFF